MCVGSLLGVLTANPVNSVCLRDSGILGYASRGLPGEKANTSGGCACGRPPRALPRLRSYSPFLRPLQRFVLHAQPRRYSEVTQSPIHTQSPGIFGRGLWTSAAGARSWEVTISCVFASQQYSGIVQRLLGPKLDTSAPQARPECRPVLDAIVAGAAAGSASIVTAPLDKVKLRYATLVVQTTRTHFAGCTY